MRLIAQEHLFLRVSYQYQPFEKDNDSNIVYKGDRGTNAVAVSETRTIGTTLMEVVFLWQLNLEIQ